EEAEDVTEAQWLDLEATVFRRDRSELWALWNPKLSDSPTDKRFLKNPPARSAIIDMNYHDNPWFPPSLEELRRREQDRLDPAMYRHIWDGAYLTNSDAQVFGNKYHVQEVTP